MKNSNIIFFHQSFDYVTESGSPPSILFLSFPFLRISACGLLPYIYKQCDEEKRTNLRNTYKEFFNDYVPMIKRAAAANLDVFISVLEVFYTLSVVIPQPKYASTEFFDFFVTLSNDDQDNIRILIIQIGILFPFLFILCSHCLPQVIHSRRHPLSSSSHHPQTLF